MKNSPAQAKPTPSGENAAAKPADDRQPPSTWRDLLLYLAAGFVVFPLATLGVSTLLRDSWQSSLLIPLAFYLLNALILAGSVYLLGVRRGKISWSSIGFLPARWRWRWLSTLVTATLLLLPIRMLLGLGVQSLIEGSLESLEARTQILTAGETLSWTSFALTFLGAGLLAPVSEELYFRGLLHGWFRSRLRFWPRVLVSSAIFGLAHLDSPAVAASSFVLGLGNAVAYELSDSLWPPIAMHITTNTLAVILLYLGLLLDRLLL